MIKNGLYITLDPQFAACRDWLTSMKAHFPFEGETVQSHRNVIKHIDFEEHRFTVKSFKIPSFFKSIIYSYFRPSKAKRSYDHACLFVQKGINTPRPVAYMEWYEHGLLKESFFVSLHKEFEATLHGFERYSPDELDLILKKFVEYTFRYLHGNAVQLGDFSPGNVLISRNEAGDFDFHFVDLNRMIFAKVGYFRGLYNFRAQRPEHLTAIAKEYARLHGKVSQKEQDFAAKTLHRFFAWHMFWPRLRHAIRDFLKKLFRQNA